MNQKIKGSLFTVTAVILLLTACAPAQATQDPAEVQRQIAQAVVETLSAQSALTAAAQPSATPLPPPTETAPPAPTVVLPTATPFVIVPPTVVSGGGGGGVPVGKPDYACDIIRRRPFDNTYFRPKDTFDIKWTIVNTGTKTMRAGLDLKYFSGTDMTNISRIELPELKPGDQYAVDLDGFAPAKEGFHVMTWVVEGQLCFPYVAIYVEKY